MSVLTLPQILAVVLPLFSLVTIAESTTTSLADQLHGPDSLRHFPAAMQCQDTCHLPHCRCSGEDIPGKLAKSQVPQFVFLTFDDALNHVNMPFYLELLSNRKNPNGHPITLTFFISHEYTDYSMVHELYRQGHEIALHSISHKSYVPYWSSLNVAGWTNEIVDQAHQIAHFANLPLSEIRGMRAPFLQGGGDSMYAAFHNTSISWDCTRATSKFLWPYTNDFANTQECETPPCAQASFPGLWTVPMIKIEGGSGAYCSMIDSCLPPPETSEETFKLLQKSFLKHLNGNRAPFGVFTHSSWLQSDAHAEIRERKKGYMKFLDYLATLKDVYIVSISRALEWIQKPVPLDSLGSLEQFKVSVKPNTCQKTSSCQYSREEYEIERWLHSCVGECPRKYPWVGNPLGH